MASRLSNKGPFYNPLCQTRALLWNSVCLFVCLFVLVPIIVPNTKEKKACNIFISQLVFWTFLVLIGEVITSWKKETKTGCKVTLKVALIWRKKNAINKFLAGFSDINNSFNSDIATLPILHLWVRQQKDWPPVLIDPQEMGEVFLWDMEEMSLVGWGRLEYFQAVLR